MAARKIMILGAIGVGKTSLANRLAFGRFETSYKATIGVDIYTTTVRRPDGSAATLVLWDTDGDFGLTIFRTIYLKGASAAVVVADLTRPPSVDQLGALLGGFRDALPGRPCAAIFNKSDLVGGVLPAFREAAREADLVTATSALSGEGVAEAFATLVEIIERRSL